MESKNKCPVCQSSLTLIPGNQISKDDGVTLYCSNIKCSAQEVFGHGSNEKNAFQIITEKYSQNL